MMVFLCVEVLTQQSIARGQKMSLLLDSSKIHLPNNDAPRFNRKPERKKNPREVKKKLPTKLFDFRIFLNLHASWCIF